MALINEWLLENPWIPWRLRQYAKNWLQSTGKDTLPSLFRLIYLNRLSTLARPITQGPFHHFFGYYDKTPWSSDEKMLLCHRVAFMDRAPGAEDKAEIGIIESHDRSWRKIAVTNAWNWQQGAMLRWYPTRPDTVLFNDKQNGLLVARFCQWETGEMNTLERPLYAISSDARIGYSINFARLQQKRPGYGYAGVSDPWADENAPRKDGIWRIDLLTGGAELIVSLAELANRNPRATFKNVPHWVNHIQVSPSGKNFLFLHRWGNATASSGFESRLYCASPDGECLNCLLDGGLISHYDWMDDESFIVWAEHPSFGKKFYLIHIGSRKIRVIGDGQLVQDGHCSFSPDRKFLITDTYANQYDLRALILFKLSDGKRVDLELLKSPKNIPAEIRCDFHPRWSPSGRYLCIDSLHEGTRQMYMLDIEKYLK
jgi:hypothetical protein